MRFRLTIFLLLANIVLFFCIWSLERDKIDEPVPATSIIPFTTLEISGKGIDKPRILKLENNRWRIVSPIDWRANLFAVNRIRNQLEFLDRETSFSLDEISKHGHGLAEYGLDDPIFIFRYGNGEKMQTLKIGKSAPIGDRVYMLDENGRRVIVVNKEFVNGLIVDVERLRNQSVFDIPRFEVSAFSIRLPVGDSATQSKAAFRRIGLKREMGKWKFETPIVANADPQEVEAFLNEICQTSAKDFSVDSSDRTGFDISVLPASITLEGTNRRQVLLLGSPTKDGKRIYARLEDNPTVFTVDASVFKNLGSIQNTLREKSFLKFDINNVVGVDISRGGRGINLRKLKTGIWDVIGSSKDGGTLTASADVGLVNDLLVKLEKVRARQFVSDSTGGDKSRYGIGADSLKITLTQSDQTSITLSIGSVYKYGGARLMYASIDGSDAVYGISRELYEVADTNFLHYRSRILEILPEAARITSLAISDIQSGKVLFDIKSADGNFDNVIRKLPMRSAIAARHLLREVRLFTVKNYLDAPFADKGFNLPGEGEQQWLYAMDLSFELLGTGSTVAEQRRWYFTKRIGGTTQYGGTKKPDAVFELTQQNIEAIFELTQDASISRDISRPAPSAPGNL